MEISEKVESKPCYLKLTNNANTNIKSIFETKGNFTHQTSERIIRTLFSSQETFLIHIEKASGKNDGELYININFDSTTNPQLVQFLNNKALSLYGAITNKELVIINVKLLNKGIGQANNRRITTYFHFFVNERSTIPFPKEVLELVQELPIAREQSRYVKSRLESWEVYLDMIVKRAEEHEAVMEFNSARLLENLRRLVMYCPDLKNHVQKKKLRKAEVKLLWEQDGKKLDETIGSVRRFIFEKNQVEVELDEDYVDYARQNKWSPISSGHVHISNYGDLAQAKRLRSGFRDLQNGVAQNPNLEYLLFEENPIMDTTSNAQTFEFKEAIQDNLNPYQRAAVQGALAAEDIYLIQGPPGTGKTTVIAEICYQNAERGLKTLVASQSNLAVDNALSKLLSHPKIRILRKGRTKSIEKEGMKYIEENVAHTWKDQTKHSVEQDISEYEVKIAEAHEKIESNHTHIKLNSEKLLFIEQSPHIKNKIKQLQIELKNHHNRLDTIQTNQEKYTLRKKELEECLLNDSTELNGINKVLQAGLEFQQWVSEKQKLQSQIFKLENHIKFLETQQSFKLSNSKNQLLKNRLTNLSASNEDIKRFIQAVEQLEFSELSQLLSQRADVDSNNLIQRQKKVTNYYHKSRKRDETTLLIKEDIKKYAKLTNNISLVIAKQEKILKKYDYDTDLAKSLVNEQSISDRDLSFVVNKLAKSAMEFTEPNMFQKIFSKLMNKRPEKVKKIIEEYTQSNGIKRAINHFVKNLEQQLTELDIIAAQLPTIIREFKNEVINCYKMKLMNTEKEMTQVKSDFIISEDHLRSINQLLLELQKELKGADLTISLTDLRGLLQETKKILQNLDSPEEYKQKLITHAKEKISACEMNSNRIKEIEGLYTDTQRLLSEEQNLLKNIQGELAEKEKISKYLDSINLNQEKLIIQKYNHELNQSIDRLNEDIKELTNKKAIQIDWIKMLNEAKDYDLQEIKKLYIKHANVIGITCVQSARRDFVEDYPDFDVVIIDEVSKATPPELLLPMLKGKKVILVGDHHQLPPLIGQETLDEVIEKIPNELKKEEVKANLKDSLFERLFKSIPEQYKTTLRTQYRMHEDIMETITQFYEDKNEPNGYGLSCGLENSNLQRDHYLNGQFIKRGQHIMWFDIPHEEEFFEEQEEGSSSRFNQSELRMISGLLQDINEATERAKLEGRIASDKKKNIGLISFYGDQVRKLKDLVDELELPNIEYRIGTVDRFQGMESDVIFASFVRNHDNKNDDIGFSNDYRRLNVALSRAKELLIITGSSKMFTQQARNANSRKMYSRVVDTIHQKNGMRDYKGRVK